MKMEANKTNTQLPEIGRMVEIELADGQVIRGKVLAHDNYSVFDLLIEGSQAVPGRDSDEHDPSEWWTGSRPGGCLNNDELRVSWRYIDAPSAQLTLTEPKSPLGYTVGAVYILPSGGWIDVSTTTRAEVGDTYVRLYDHDKHTITYETDEPRRLAEGLGRLRGKLSQPTPEPAIALPDAVVQAQTQLPLDAALLSAGWAPDTQSRESFVTRLAEDLREVDTKLREAGWDPHDLTREHFLDEAGSRVNAARGAAAAIIATLTAAEDADIEVRVVLVGGPEALTTFGKVREGVPKIDGDNYVQLVARDGAESYWYTVMGEHCECGVPTIVAVEPMTPAVTPPSLAEQIDKADIGELMLLVAQRLVPSAVDSSASSRTAFVPQTPAEIEVVLQNDYVPRSRVTGNVSARVWVQAPSETQAQVQTTEIMVWDRRDSTIMISGRWLTYNKEHSESMGTPILPQLLRLEIID